MQLRQAEHRRRSFVDSVFVLGDEMTVSVMVSRGKLDFCG